MMELEDIDTLVETECKNFKARARYWSNKRENVKDPHRQNVLEYRILGLQGKENCLRESWAFIKGKLKMRDKKSLLDGIKEKPFLLRLLDGIKKR